MGGDYFPLQANDNMQYTMYLVWMDVDQKNELLVGLLQFTEDQKIQELVVGALKRWTMILLKVECIQMDAGPHNNPKVLKEKTNKKEKVVFDNIYDFF